MRTIPAFILSLITLIIMSGCQSIGSPDKISIETSNGNILTVEYPANWVAIRERGLILIANETDYLSAIDLENIINDPTDEKLPRNIVVANVGFVTQQDLENDALSLDNSNINTEIIDLILEDTLSNSNASVSIQEEIVNEATITIARIDDPLNRGEIVLMIRSLDSGLVVLMGVTSPNEFGKNKQS